MKRADVHEAKTQFSALIAELEAGRNRVVICRNGKPIADLLPHQEDISMDADPELGAIVVRYDPTEPLSDEEWPAAFP